jgi:hypothetical protein
MPPKSLSPLTVPLFILLVPIADLYGTRNALRINNVHHVAYNQPFFAVVRLSTHRQFLWPIHPENAEEDIAFGVGATLEHAADYTIQRKHGAGWPYFYLQEREIFPAKLVYKSAEL